MSALRCWTAAAGAAALVACGAQGPQGVVRQAAATQLAAAMSAARSGVPATLLADGRVLVAGGDTADAEVFDPFTGRWSATAPLRYRRQGHAATLLPDGTVLVAGGADPQLVATCERWDPATGQWSDAGALRYPRRAHALAPLADGRVLVAGGIVSPGIAAKVAEVFDPTRNAWTARPTT